MKDRVVSASTPGCTFSKGPGCDGIPAAPDAAEGSRGDAADVPAWLSSLVSVDWAPARVPYDPSDPPTAAPAGTPAPDVENSSEPDCACVPNDESDIAETCDLCHRLLLFRKDYG